MNETDELI